MGDDRFLPFPTLSLAVSYLGEILSSLPPYTCIDMSNYCKVEANYRVNAQKR